MSLSIARLFIVVTLLLTGCEGAQVPLGDADDMPLDSRFLGKWIALDDEQDASELIIRAFNEYEYFIEFTEIDDEPETSMIRAFSTEIKDAVFANVYCINCGEEEAEWFFFRYELESDDILAIQGIRDTHYRNAMSDMTRSRDVFRYVRKHLYDEGFFEEEVARFKRVK